MKSLLILIQALALTKSNPSPNAVLRAAEAAIPEGGWLFGGAGWFSAPLSPSQSLVIPMNNLSFALQSSLNTPIQLNTSLRAAFNAPATSTASTETQLEWGGIKANGEELASVRSLRAQLNAFPLEAGISPWIHSCSDAEILRFLRHEEGRVEDTLRQLHKHAQWRVSQYGADTIMQDESYSASNIHKEIFWLGESRDGCPTLVIRTQAHDGADYDEDPRQFMSVLVQILERGKQLYGVGIHKQVCLLLDRGPVAGRDRSKERDMSVIPNLVALFRHVHGTVMNNYPELLQQARIVPSSWFFSACYKLTSVVLDPASRQKFLMVRPEDVFSELSALFPAHMLPPHLGGTATIYGGQSLFATA